MTKKPKDNDQLETAYILIGKYASAFNMFLTGGNHLASLLIGNLGPGFADEYPFNADPNEVREKMGYCDSYEIWCCWSALMKARREVHGE